MAAFDQTIPDQTHEVMLAGVKPAQMLSAAIALAERPGVSRKPSVLQCRHAGFPATNRLRKGNDIKTNALWVGETKLGLSLRLEPVPLVSHAVQAPATEPVTFGRRGCNRRTRSFCRLDLRRRHQAVCCCGRPVHWKMLTLLPVESNGPSWCIATLFLVGVAALRPLPPPAKRRAAESVLAVTMQLGGKWL